jgi:hypothetical protein
MESDIDPNNSQVVLGTPPWKMISNTQVAVIDSQETCELLLQSSPKAKAKNFWIRKSNF